MKKIFTLISFFMVTILNAGYYGILNNEVYIVINGVTTRATNQITLTGPGPHVLQDIYIQTEKQIYNGESNICGGNLSWSLSGGNSGSGVVINFFQELGIPPNQNNQRQEWRASPNATLLPTTNNSTLTITINLTGHNNAYTGCPDTKTFVYGSNVLPVTFGKISAFQKDRIVKLQWEVFLEQNHDYYEAQKSTNGIEWTSFATVKTLDTRSKKKVYEAVDYNPLIGSNYYRIKQFDLDGTVSYSKTVSVLFKDLLSEDISFSNPIIGNTLELQINNKSAERVFIIDQLGRNLIDKAVIADDINSIISLPFDNHPKGIYILAIQDKNGKIISRKNILKI